MTDPCRVLVVDDAPEQTLVLDTLLTREGFVVRTAHDGEAALELVRSFDPDLVVLDIVMPRLDGTEVCRRLRASSDAYVIMLTSRADEVDKVVGLSVGADDYMVKPFSPRELVARIAAMLRRPRRPAPADADRAPEAGAGRGAGVGDGMADASRRSFGSLEIDALAREVHVDGNEAALTKLEFDLLDVLSSRPEMVFTRALLREQVWGPDWYGDDHVIDVHMKNLRRKIDPPEGPSRIKTVRGVGYRMNVPAA